MGKTPWRRKWKPTPVFLPGKSHGQRSPVGYSPWGHKRVRHDLAMTTHVHTQVLAQSGFRICSLVEFLSTQMETLWDRVYGQQGSAITPRLEGYRGRGGLWFRAEVTPWKLASGSMKKCSCCQRPQNIKPRRGIIQLHPAIMFSQQVFPQGKPNRPPGEKAAWEAPASRVISLTPIIVFIN